MASLSPFAPKRFPRLPAVGGVRLAAGACGIRRNGRRDLMLVELAAGTTVAGAFTRSRTVAPSVVWNRRAARRGLARAIVANSGNANAFTGEAGMAAVRATAAAVAKRLACPPGQVFMCSTGVIGEPLPVARILDALPRLADGLDPKAWPEAAESIRTTDTFAKGASAVARIGGVPVRIAGIAKGSGMIAPNMATMLAFVFTDAKVPARVLKALLDPAVEASFNAITVDSDTSTSDTVLLAATGRGPRHPPVRGARGPLLADFRAKLQRVLTDLAHQIVKDGEGAEKFITVTVTGAASDRAAKAIALSIANSPLVKTAFAGGDPNWGRVVMAVGKAGQRIDPGRLRIAIGGVRITEHGRVRPGYDERPVARHLKGREIAIEVDVGVRGGRGRARVWTCDFTHGYISINADYRS